MSNIVERLRDNPGIDEAVRLCEEAADTITTLRAQVAKLEADKAKLREELSAAVGYMTNAAIDLDTGAPKRTALATINGGIQRARLALAETGEKP